MNRSWREKLVILFSFGLHVSGVAYTVWLPVASIMHYKEEGLDCMHIKKSQRMLSLFHVVVSDISELLSMA